jgi:hypothetical protein
MWDEEEPSDEEFQARLERNKAWVTPSELAALGLERASGFKTDNGGPESPVDQAARMMRENAPLAAMTLIKLAQKGDSETVRLRASVEILNRADAAGQGQNGGNPWDGVYEAVMVTKVQETKEELESKGVQPASIEDKDLPR